MLLSSLLILVLVWSRILVIVPEVRVFIVIIIYVLIYLPA